MTGILIPAPTEADWLAAAGGHHRQPDRDRDGPGPGDWASPFSLYHQKLGNLPEPEDSISMRVGRHLESLVADLFAEQRPEFTLAGTGRELYAHPARPWEIATPDRIVYENPEDAYQYPGVPMVDPLAVLEAKTSAGDDGWGEDGSDEIPVHHRCQVLWQMDVLGVTAAFVACLFLPSRTFRVYELTLDDDARADLKRCARKRNCSGPASPAATNRRLTCVPRPRTRSRPCTPAWNSRTSPLARRWPCSTAPPSAGTRSGAGCRAPPATGPGRAAPAAAAAA